jgi:phosphoglycerate dehydrogenase-like enzyme
MHVHLESAPSPALLADFHAWLSEAITVTFGEIPTPATYEILVAGRPGETQLQASPSLKSVIVPFAGIPPATRTLLTQFPHLTLHNLHYNVMPTSEMAVALLFAVAKSLIPADQLLRRHDWSARYAPAPSRLLHGKTALILGYGNIGQQVGVVLKAIGMKVLGTRRRHSDPANGIYTAEHLHTLLPQTNVLIVVLPATDDTEGLIGAPELALLPQGAIVVNVGRGPVIDQFALYDALKGGYLFGAGLDVWYHYPKDDASRTNTPPADVPFHELENVVLSPHRAGGGGEPEIEALRFKALAESLNHAAQGNPLPNQVDVALGY